LSFESAVIAAGSRAVSPPGFEFDGRLILSAKDALDLESAPQSLAVIGGGVIGLELGTVFAKLGAKVFVVEALDQLLPGVEPELSGVVARSLRRLGVEVFLRSKALGWAEKGSEVELSVGTPEGERTLRVGRVLSCVGRRPESDSLGLEAAGVAVGDGGFIRVDEGFRTSAPGIFAAGDVVSPPFLAHKASREGTLAAMSLCGAAPLPAPGFIPSAVYTDPELASVGESEAQARARGAEVLVGRFPFSACGRAHTLRETEGFVKLVADARGGRLLGASIAGPDASDLIGEAALALKLGATLSDIAGTVHPHPTLCEALAEAAEAALGHPVNIPPARR
jgi:dihydrolipoamide dehydrogenase